MNLAPEEIYNNINQIGKNEGANILFKLYYITDNAIKRQKILKTLFKIEDTEHFKEIESTLMSDEDYNCRLEAVKILVNFYKDKAIKPLRWALENDRSWKVRVFIIEKLSLLDNNSSTEILIKGLEDQFKEVRNKSAKLISEKLKEKPQFIPLLLQKLQDKRFFVRWAVESALLLINKLPTKVLIDYLEDDNYYTKRAIIRILGKLNAIESIPILINLYEKELDPYIKGEILTAFGRFQDEKGMKIVKKTLINEKNHHLKYTASQTLKNIHLNSTNDE